MTSAYDRLRQIDELRQSRSAFSAKRSGPSRFSVRAPEVVPEASSAASEDAGAVQSDFSEDRPGVPAAVSGSVIPSERLLISPQELAKLCGVHRNTVDRWAKAGELVGQVRLGGKVFYHLPTVEAWLLERASSPVT